jgi:hypothetical protein
MKKVFRVSLIACAIGFSSMSQASLQQEMNQLFGSMTNTTAPGVFESQRRGVISGGSVMLCAGFIEGAFMGVASNWLFAARYEAMIGPSIAMLENTGFYTGDQIEMMMKLMRSPLVQLFSGMLASAIKGGFFGLFIAAFTKRDPDVFSEGTNQ